ncbi:hypothetical protein DPMN_023809 [Dreissena polymorpha]|uniref:EGF-like domain-containing protein n=1 Tax=Dreissena polymorpha TaxID=45954 RepID=A0A9D4LMY0_DREPO|nr:hypothetical protein DPMN_023809 [Dreissena polymorpha]
MRCLQIVNIFIIDAIIVTADKGGICDVVPKRSDCIEQSTHCVNKDIDEDYFDCECNAGFKKPITGKKRDVYCDGTVKVFEVLMNHTG